MKYAILHNIVLSLSSSSIGCVAVCVDCTGQLRSIVMGFRKVVCESDGIIKCNQYSMKQLTDRVL